MLMVFISNKKKKSIDPKINFSAGHKKGMTPNLSKKKKKLIVTICVFSYSNIIHSIYNQPIDSKYIVVVTPQTCCM